MYIIYIRVIYLLSLSIAIVKAIARSKRTRVNRVAYWPRETKAAKRLVYTVQLGNSAAPKTKNLENVDFSPYQNHRHLA